MWAESRAPAQVQALAPNPGEGLNRHVSSTEEQDDLPARLRSQAEMLVSLPGWGALGAPAANSASAILAGATQHSVLPD